MGHLQSSVFELTKDLAQRGKSVESDAPAAMATVFPGV